MLHCAKTLCTTVDILYVVFTFHINVHVTLKLRTERYVGRRCIGDPRLQEPLEISDSATVYELSELPLLLRCSWYWY